MATDSNSSHYDLAVAGTPCEVADIQRALLLDWTGNPYVAHCLATALKYIFRCGKKGDSLQDLCKALVYMVWAVAAANKGRLPNHIMDAVDNYAPEQPAEIFPPIQESSCKDGFCPVQLYAGTAD